MEEKNPVEHVQNRMKSKTWWIRNTCPLFQTEKLCLQEVAFKTEPRLLSNFIHTTKTKSRLDLKRSMKAC